MISFFQKRARWALTLAALFASVTFAHASVVITGTRVIYPANQREVSVKLNNNGGEPALVQSWIDDGDADAKSKDKAMPFTLLPPVARIDPGKGQTLRMMYTQDPLPQDRESVFYLNVLEIPPRASGELKGENVLQMAFRSRIKIFFRPTGLAGNPNETPSQVTWQVVKSEDGKGYALKGDNPTVFHASYSETSVKFGDKTYVSDGGMIPPNGSRLFPLADLHTLPAGTPEITFNAIDDYGGSHGVTLKPGVPSQAQQNAANG